MTIDEYVEQHIDEEPALLKQLGREAHVKLLRPRMLSGHLQGRLLKMLVQMVCPLNVLELGTYTGYSALCMAEGLEKPGAMIHTLEIDDEMEDFSRGYFEKSEYGKRICLYIGDALEIIPTFGEAYFDMAFIDADKRLYWDYFELVLPKLRRGGLIVADNTLWGGKILEPPTSNDWQTKGVIEFNEKLAGDNRVEKVILPIRDGLTLIRKK
ncbi:MAG: O-methyltransferase [Dysgonamonadaceae bacterium]|jgi:predicted O-methyltransferase YrrM|nr:O-methyltransferase [Dysgonamonadaceae bacterium]